MREIQFVLYTDLIPWYILLALSAQVWSSRMEYNIRPSSVRTRRSIGASAAGIALLDSSFLTIKITGSNNPLQIVCYPGTIRTDEI